MLLNTLAKYNLPVVVRSLPERLMPPIVALSTVKPSARNVNIPDALSNDNIFALSVVRETSVNTTLSAESVTTKLPLSSLIFRPPRLIVAPDRYRSRNFLLELPRSYASLLSGMIEPVSESSAVATVRSFVSLSYVTLIFVPLAICAE